MVGCKGFQVYLCRLNLQLENFRIRECASMIHDGFCKRLFFANSVVFHVFQEGLRIFKCISHMRLTIKFCKLPVLENQISFGPFLETRVTETMANDNATMLN